MKQLILSAICVLGLASTALADSKVAKIKVKASIYCDHCQKCESCGKRLENAIYDVKGVKRMDLNTADNTVEIVYNAEKTNPDKLRAAIAKVGFDADDVKGNQEAYEKWDDCCKKQ